MRRLLIAILICLLLPIQALAVSYVDVGATTNFDGDVGVPSGSGYYINGVQVTSAILSDYVEGEYEPTVTCSTSGSYTTGTNTTLAYTKIGRIVHIQGVLQIDSASSPNGYILISLPFTSADLTEGAGRAFGGIMLQNHGGTIVNAMAYVAEGLDYIYLADIADNGTLSTLDNNSVDTAWNLYCSFTYFTN